MSETTAIVQRIKKNAALNYLGDTDRYKCRFDVPGSTGNIYRVSFDAAPGAGYWVCSCRGCIAHGQCKHLTAMGLYGRKMGKSLKWVEHFRMA